MSTSRLLSRRSATPAKSASPDLKLGERVEDQVRRYAPSARRAIRRLARTSPRFADLAVTFPAALYVLATDQAASEHRAQAHELVRGGAALRDVARVLGLPLWMRRLPPETFSGALPAMPVSDTFARRIANRLPTPHSTADFWLRAVAFADGAAHEDFAVWLAEQPMHRGQGDPVQLLAVLAAYAWFSRAPGTAACNLISIPWRQELSMETALCSAKSWLNRIRLVLQLKPGVVTDPWFEAAHALGYSFTPLLDSQALLREAQAMQNCCDQYSDRIARDKCRLFRIADATGSVAMVEVGPHPREVGVLTLNQLKGRHNIPAGVDVWQAAHHWASQQRGIRRMPALMPKERPLCGKDWSSLMQPYIGAVGRNAGLTGELTSDTFSTLEVGLAELARRAGVSSWLFN
jgi:hypothetical protein